MNFRQNLLHLYKNYKLIFFIFLIYLIPRLISLGSDMSNYDASYWYPRMDSFIDHLLKGEYLQTYQKYHPGVTLMWLSGGSKYVFQQLFEFVFHFNPRFIPQQFIRLNWFSIFPLVFVISVLGAISFELIRKITNTKFAIIFSIMLSIEPFFYGVSKYLHLSGLGGMLSYTSFLFLYYYYFLRKTENKENRKLLYISSILIGLGLLTKIDSALGMVFNFLTIAYFEFTLNKKISDFLIGTLKNSCTHGLIAATTFFICFPAMWVAPYEILQKIYDDGILDTAFDSGGEDTLFGIKKLFYPEFIFLRNLPTTFVFILVGIALSIKKILRPISKWTEFDRFLIIAALGYTIFSVMALTIPEKNKDRYITNFYPALMLLAAYGLYYFYNKQKYIKYFVISIAVFAYAFTAYRYYPVYSYYYSDALGGPKYIEKMGLNIKNRGEYYAQIAQYINKTDPKAVEKNVVLGSREQIRTFQPFFYGTTYTNTKFLPDGQNTDYITIRADDGKELLVPEQCTFVKSFGPKAPLKYEAIKLFKCENLDNSYKDFNN